MFLAKYVDRNPELLNRVSKPGLMLDAVPEVDVAVRLWREGLLDEAHRRQFVSTVLEYCINGEDPGVFFIDGVRGMLTSEENEAFRGRLKDELIPALADVLSEWEWSFDSYTDPPPPDEHMRHLEDLLYGLELEFPGDDELRRRAERVEQGIEEFVAVTSRSEREYDDDWYREDSAAPAPPSSVTRSVFDDLLD